jgi:hypothetical protein
MGRPRKTNPVEILDALAALAGTFDYRVDPEDFILYELARLIDEDRASLDDPEFQELIDEGIREHVETNLPVRAELTGIFRVARRNLAPEAQILADRLIRALEEPQGSLRGAAVVVRSYTAYLFDQLQRETPGTAGELAEQQISEWRAGRLTAEKLIASLASLGPGAAASAADLLFDLEDRASVEIAIAALGQIGSAPATRALAHAISEPMLDEDLEQTAFESLKRLWPHPRHYMLFTLRRHEHEDLPVKWFQLFAQCGELEAVDRTLEELTRHGGETAYRDDLTTIVNFLRTSSDPEISTKIIEALNDPETPRAASAILEEFLKTGGGEAVSAQTNPWRRLQRLDAIHQRYRAAAALADAGRVEEARRALDRILVEEPDYPFALMLRRLIEVG